MHFINHLSTRSNRRALSGRASSARQVGRTRCWAISEVGKVGFRPGRQGLRLACSVLYFDHLLCSESFSWQINVAVNQRRKLLCLEGKRPRILHYGIFGDILVTASSKNAGLVLKRILSVHLGDVYGEDQSFRVGMRDNDRKMLPRIAVVSSVEGITQSDQCGLVLCPSRSGPIK